MGITVATYPVGLRSFPALPLINPPIPRTCFLCSSTELKESLFINNGPIGIWSRRGGRRSRFGKGYSGARMSAVELDPSVTLMKKAVEIFDALKGTSLFIVGMNCTLKTSIAKVLADALRYYYFDSDSLVVQAAGGEVNAESLRQADESGFRKSETEVLKQLSSMGRLVVCAGDGAVQGSTNLSYLRYGISVWIDVPLDILADEVIKLGASENLVQNASSADSYLELQDDLMRRYEDLKEGYANADATVSLQRLAVQLGYDDVNAVTSEDLALEVLKQIEKLIRVKKMMEEAAKPF